MCSPLFERLPVRLCPILVLLICLSPGLCLAQTTKAADDKVDPGQADLDEAVILRIDADSKDVVVGQHETLARQQLTASDANWLVEMPATKCRCGAQIRYNSAAQPATVELLTENTFQVTFDEPCFGVAPGQAVVCYDGERVFNYWIFLCCVVLRPVGFVALKPLSNGIGFEFLIDFSVDVVCGYFLRHTYRRREYKHAKRDAVAPLWPASHT